MSTHEIPATGNASAPDRANRAERALPNRPWPLTGYRFLIVVAALIYLAAVLVGRRLGAKAPVGA